MSGNVPTPPTSELSKSDPVRALEAHEEACTDDGDDEEHCRISPNAFQLGHVVEIHAVDARDCGRHR